MRNNCFAKLYDRKVCNWMIMFIGGVCLESYIVHMHILSDSLNFLFPLNLILIYTVVIVAANFVRCVARFILQTFQKESYCWTEIFKII